MPTATPSSKKQRSTLVRYHLIADDFRRQIECGELQAGDKLPSYLEMNNSRGWATYTIDRAYSVLEREGLIERRGRSGIYVSHPHTRRIQDVIGIACSRLLRYQHHPYFMELLAGVQQTLEAEGVQVLLMNGGLSEVKWNKVGGVLFYEAASALARYSAKLPAGMPAVSLLERCEQDSLSSVTADDFNGARQATEYLIAQGHRRIACMISEETPVLQSRLAAYRESMSEAGLEVNPQWRHDTNFFKPGYDFVEAGRKTMRQWLHEDWPQLGCTALLCQNDEVAAGALQALRASGVLVPQDVSILGFDDQRICNLVWPTLSSVQVPLQAIGARAARLLLEQMRTAGESEVQSIVLPTHLKVRESSAPATTHSQLSG